MFSDPKSTLWPQLHYFPMSSAFFPLWNLLSSRFFPQPLKRHAIGTRLPFLGILTKHKNSPTLKGRFLNGGVLGTGISGRGPEGSVDQSNIPEIIHQSSLLLHPQVSLTFWVRRIRYGRQGNRWTYRQKSKRKQQPAWSNPSSCNKDPLQGVSASEFNTNSRKLLSLNS